MAWFSWSRTAATNSSADSTINWAEGQAPSSVNDSARAMMAAAAKYRDDIAGAIATGGTSTAYTVTSYSVFDTLAHMDGQIIAFTPHTGNGATVTLNVDGLGAKPLRSAPSVELQTGALIQGTPYLALYNNSDAAFYLHGASNYNSYSIPLSGLMPYAGSTAPNSAFVLPYGQAISRTTYATLFSLLSTNYGVGNGSTTFNIPDIRGRVIAGFDDMGGSNAARLSTVLSSTSTNGSGGVQQITLVTGNLPAYTPVGSITGTPTVGIGVNNTTVGVGAPTGNADGQLVAYGSGTAQNALFNVNLGTVAFAGNAQGGTSTPFNTVQPTIVMNYIMRII